MGGRDHAMECPWHPGEFYSGLNGPDECERCAADPLVTVQLARADLIEIADYADEIKDSLARCLGGTTDGDLPCAKCEAWRPLLTACEHVETALKSRA